MLAVAALAALALLAPTHAAMRLHTSDPYSIMVPEGTTAEPWVAPPLKSPRGLPQRPNGSRRHHRAPPPPSVELAEPAPPIVLPSGRVIPNLPPVHRGVVPGGGAETFGDRALRCAHQSAANSISADQQPTYMHSCTMQ